MSDILFQTITAFISSLAFLWARTYNVIATAHLEVKKVILSGMIIHILWLISISIGANGAYKVMVDHDYSYVPVILSSLIGSTIGAYIGIKQKIKRNGKR